MYLKRLELQGYKSFARKTEFVFDQGITAIVGPNGTGKSNIADAVRWALGETRMSQLRAKVTDDLIFAGSNSRARLGMAQVSMTLDNGDGTLPIDYSEVTIERRAYRDGQNEYLINGTKVRLRDIVELLGAAGVTRDAYTVIGQGLVDKALSLRPQERRTLIDVAAGIRPLQDKRERALSQLEETRANLTRVRDIAAEIAPRLRRLEKQAERARQGAQISEELQETLKTWYGYKWHTGQQALRNARTRAKAARETLAQRQRALKDLERRIENRRDREEEQVNALSELREQRAELRGRYEAVRRDLAVRRERMTLLQRRQEELAQEIADLQAQHDAQQRQLMETDAELAHLSERCEELAARIESIQRERAGTQQRKAEYRFALEGARQKALELSSTLTETRNRLSTLEERQTELTQERDSQQEAVADLTDRIDNSQAALEAARQQTEKHKRALQQLEHDREECQASLESATARLETLDGRADDARRQLERLQARREALAEVRTADGGGAPGAQAILSARGELKGVVGSVASLIRVPAEFETAIEAALGPALQAVVVETWADAQQALAWLRDNQAGRATLILSRGAGVHPGVASARKRGSGRPEKQGIIGIAADLVDCKPDHKALVQRLLGQIIVVDELETVQRISPGSLPVPFSSAIFATLNGTVVHPSGHITGGDIRAQVLGRERQWRELPAQIQAAEAKLGRLEEQQTQVQALVETLTRRLAEIDAKLRQTQATRADAQSAVEQAQRDIETLHRELTWRRGVIEQRSEELQAIENRIEEMQGRLDRIQSVHADAQDRVKSLEGQLDELEAESLRDELAEVEKELAVAQRDRQNRQARQQELRTALTNIDNQIENKQSRTNALSTETNELRAGIEAIAGDEGQLSEAIDELETKIAPAEDALRTMRREGRDWEREAARARDLLRQAEATVSEVNLEVQRQEDRLTALQDKIADDLELAAVHEELPQQLALELEDNGAEMLPAVTEVPEELERRVKRLRHQLRQVGSASPEIIAEHEETKKRYDFLKSQIEDLEEAADDLRAVASELTEVMAERFATTYGEMTEAFEEYFKQLFGGGEARMSLIEDEEDSASSGSGYGEPGLEIVARPPGKRSQSLALLSGGERALTAVALLFSLLRVSPTPFCVLDEVDATLDEANIERFCSALEGLAEDTQFIIITHNRGTIQAADTMYGISMSDEGVSQAISLKLDELEPVPAGVSKS